MAENDELTAGPSRINGGDQTDDAPSRGSVEPKGERKRKAGGDGKKGKVFLEDKAGLLDLISSVTDSKDAITQSRIAKHKSRGPEGTGESVKRIDGESTSAKNKRLEREKALLQAKVTVVEKLRAKKRKRKAETEVVSPTVGMKPKKRVGFA